MNLRDLKKLVKHGETDDVEFKASAGQVDRAVETLCAFLNKNGGTALLGVTDDGELVGQKITDEIKRDIANKLNRIEPHPNIETVFLPVSKGKDVIVLIAKPGTNGPYVCNGKPYVRVQSTTKVMPQEEYKRILSANMPKIAWDSLTTNDCTIDDLDKNRIRQIVEMAVLEKRLTDIAIRAKANEILKKFNLMVGDRLTNAAVILFCKNEQKQFIQSMIKLARFKGLDKTEFIDHKVMRGNLFDLYERAMSFLDNYLPIGGRIEDASPFRIDSPAIPPKVLREALINAFCHRDYNSPGGSITIAIYDDRVEIANTGRLPSDIKLSDLSKKHESFPRNPRIANVLYLSRIIEQWGRGTLDMISLCKQSGNPIPKFEESTGSFSVTFPLREPIARIVLSRMPSVKLTKRQQEMVKILKHGSMSKKQIMEKMQNPPTDRIAQVELSSLKELGVIVQEGKGRYIIWRLLNP